jgi:excisionase family DNA binding protein
MSTVEKRYYTEKEFCEMMGITRKTAHKWRKDKTIGFIRTPTGLIRYRLTDIQEYERRNGVRPRAQRAA